MAASSVSPSGGPSSTEPAGMANGPYKGKLEIGSLGGAPIPRGAGIWNAPPGLVSRDGTRGNAGPGRPPRRASPAPGTFSNGRPPAPGERPKLVTPASAPAGAPVIVGNNSSASWARASRTPRAKA